MSAAPPVFVIGAPRSGTTLVAAAIAAHPSLRGGPESHFFNNIAAADRAAAVDDPRWPTHAVELLERLSRDDERVIDMFDVTPAQLTNYLRTRPPSQAAMLAALFLAAADDSDAGGRWVEKTPNHLWRLDEIVEHFPDAPIIHVVRDPRDVSRSLQGLPWATTSRIGNAWMWSSWLHELTRASRNPRIAARITEVRFEDFLADPGPSLRRLCDGVGLDFNADMLTPERSAGAMVTAGEWWKTKNATAIDPTRAFAWRRDADDLDDVIATMCFEELEPRGYDTGDRPHRRLPLASFTFLDAALLEGTLTRAARSGVSIVPAPDDAPGTTWLWSEREALRAGRRGTAIRIARVRLRRTRALRSTRTLRRDRVFERER